MPGFPPEVTHVCWLVDLWGRKLEEISGSDILYTFAGCWVNRFKAYEAARYIDYLPPGVNTNIFFPQKHSTKCDFVFLGHIPRPWSETELARTIVVQHDTRSRKPKQKVFTFGELNKNIEEYVLNKNIQNKDPDIIKHLNRKFNLDLSQYLCREMMYDITSRAIRQIRRNAALKLCSCVSSSIKIYGTSNWKEYPAYRRYYSGFLNNLADIREAMQQGRIIINDIFFPHFRTFEAMASGITVATSTPPGHYGNDWENLNFIEGKDYISLNIFSHNINSIKRYLQDTPKQEEVTKNAYFKVTKYHTWAHRAEKVLRDVRRIRYRGNQ